MTSGTLTSAGIGLEVIDLLDDPEFAARRLHTRDLSAHSEGLRRLTRAFVERPATILQELINAAVELCGADSAGISLVQDQPTESDFYQWVATAGKYAHFVNATLPRNPSACGLCLERGRPQHFRVSKPFFDLMQVEAPVVSDGVLLPWQVDEVKGTIWIMAHERTDAFDREDLALMEVLADFAAMAVRHQRQQSTLMKAAGAQAAASMANELAHEINNPLQSLTNLVYLAARSTDEIDSQFFIGELQDHLDRLSLLVSRLLALPIDAARSQAR